MIAAEGRRMVEASKPTDLEALRRLIEQAWVDGGSVDATTMPSRLRRQLLDELGDEQAVHNFVKDVLKERSS